MKKDSEREVARAESGCPGVGRQEAVGEEEEDRKQREGEILLFIALLLFLLIFLRHHQQCHSGRSGVGRKEGEVELTSPTSWRSMRVYCNILHI